MPPALPAPRACRCARSCRSPRRHGAAVATTARWSSCPPRPTTRHEPVTYPAAVALALVFAVAAMAKWRDGHRVQPALELALAAALLIAPGWAGIVAVAVLVGFTTYLVRAMRRRQPCNCFGSASTEPVSAVQLVRNAVLLA